MIRKIRFLTFGVILFSGIFTACSVPEPEMVEVTVIVEPTSLPEITPPEFEGVWFSQDRSSMLVIGTEFLYLHEFGPNREVYARIDGIDLEEETIDVFVSAIIIGGRSVGYDSPNIQINYHLNGTMMEFLGQHIDFAPDEEGPVFYIYDEYLN
ncbi:MAG: hypothetical protein HON98_08575 [Chloroflexi bacterium]|jgi:hypothetical protein|nr:hypothetical protein [Chloroflexota bacterium]MBT3668636.1 hypothetical protein [Chloroflexota bacterium]MBT4002007.1 hypothetical protein [Chloroflexota bacterium]MBT4304139.1 hypothetical protein [Chloroflexota bacterium]MBT4533227.1 hypothetical protein [Chloroflexota bacterium]